MMKEMGPPTTKVIQVHGNTVSEALQNAADWYSEHIDNQEDELFGDVFVRAITISEVGPVFVNLFIYDEHGLITDQAQIVP